MTEVPMIQKPVQYDSDIRRERVKTILIWVNDGSSKQTYVLSLIRPLKGHTYLLQQTCC